MDSANGWMRYHVTPRFIGYAHTHSEWVHGEIYCLHSANPKCSNLLYYLVFYALMT